MSNGELIVGVYPHYVLGFISAFNTAACADRVPCYDMHIPAADTLFATYDLYIQAIEDALLANPGAELGSITVCTSAPVHERCLSRKEDSQAKIAHGVGAALYVSGHDVHMIKTIGVATASRIYPHPPWDTSGGNAMLRAQNAAYMMLCSRMYDELLAEFPELA